MLITFVAILQVVYSYNFTDYLAEFNKSYSTPEEFVLRQFCFDQNYSLILQINSQNLSYTLKANEMTDWTQAELTARLGFRPSGDLPTTWNETPALRKVGASINASVDWRNNGKVTSVKNQGHCGSCWAFAATALYQSFMAQTENKKYDFSEEYLLECTPTGDCKSGPIDKALSLIQSTGMPLDSNYPYKAFYVSQGRPFTPNICSASGIKHDFRIFPSTNVSDEDLRTYLNIGPVVVGMEAGRDFSLYSTGIHSCSKQTSISNLNHAVELIGYDTRRNWIIKNSWGPTWGYSGFGYINSSSASNCGVNLLVYRLFDERVGILVGIILAITSFAVI